MAPCDILLLLSASEGDAPKVIELLAAGAYADIKVSSAPFYAVACLHSMPVCLTDRCSCSASLELLYSTSQAALCAIHVCISTYVALHFSRKHLHQLTG